MDLSLFSFIHQVLIGISSSSSVFVRYLTSSCNLGFDGLSTVRTVQTYPRVGLVDGSRTCVFPPCESITR